MIGKNFCADFYLITTVRELFLTLLIGLLKRVKFFILMTNKECYPYTNSFHSHHWKNFNADFHLKTGVRELLLTLFILSSEKSEVFSSLWLIRIATSIQTNFTVIIGKNFSADFHLKTAVRELFLTLFNLSCEESEVFWSLWLIRIVTSIQTVFTVIFGKDFSADFLSKTGVRELFVTLLLGLLKRVKFCHPYD